MLVPAGCSALQTPASSPSVPWTEVVTRHFVLRTDHDPRTAREAAAALERTFSMVSDLAFESRDMPSMKIEVVHFRRLADGQEVARWRGAPFALGRWRQGARDPRVRPLQRLVGR